MIARAITIVAFLIAALFSFGAAHAHATLVFSHPAEAALLDQAPATIRLRFNEVVTPLQIRLIDANGAARDDLEVSVQNDMLEITPSSVLTEGTHTLSYRVISADGHPVGGTLSFSVGHVSGSPGQTITSPGRLIAIWMLRSIFYTTFFFGVAGCVFLRVAPGSRSTLLLLCLSCATIAGLASLGFQGLDMLDADVGGLLQSGTWRQAFGSPFGLTIAIAFCAIALAALSLSTAHGRIGAALAAASVLCAGAAIAASGHAGTASPQALMRFAVLVHIVCIVLLISPLPALARILVVEPSGLRSALQRFAKPALISLGLVVVSGALLALVQVQTISGLVTTSYGWILIAKLSLVAALLAIVAYGRTVLSPAAKNGSTKAATAMRHIGKLELATIVVILSVTALWRFTPPPRALALASQSLHIHTDKMMAMIYFQPGLVGANNVRIELFTGDFGPLPVKEVRLVLTPLDGSIEPLNRQAIQQSDGQWEIGALYVPSAGAWNVSVSALVTDFDKVEISDSFVFKK